MPAVIDPTRCNRNWNQCFPARICPEGALKRDFDGNIFIASEHCAECPGPCVNFCDGYAIMYDRDPGTFEIMKAQVLGDLSADDVLAARQALATSRREREAAARPVVDVTAETFVSEVLESPLPVVVDFWAPWCGPCKMMAPIFEELAGEFAGKLKFAKVDTEDQPQLAAQFRITSIPTMLAFDQGQIVDGAGGALPKPQLTQFVNRVLTASLEATQSEPPA